MIDEDLDVSADDILEASRDGDALPHPVSHYDDDDVPLSAAADTDYRRIPLDYPALDTDMDGMERYQDGESAALGGF
jgi:hypothetical protein